MRRRLTVLIGLAFLVGSALPVIGADAREPREPRRPGETRSGSGDGGGPSARSGDASASNSVSGLGGRGHVSQRTSVETGDVVVGGTVRGTADGRTTSGEVSEPEEPTPEPTPAATPELREPTPGDGIVSSERIDAEPAGGHADAAGPDLATWIMVGVMLLGFAIVFRKLPRPDAS